MTNRHVRRPRRLHLHRASAHRAQANGPHRQSGVGLIEVMVAVVVLSFGMLGLAAMQALALRNSQSALERSQAVVHAYAMFDAMRANRAAALINRYDIPRTCAAPDAGDLIANDLRRWITAMRQDRALGRSACGRISCGSLACTVTVEWDDSRGIGGNAAHQLRITTRL